MLRSVVALCPWLGSRWNKTIRFDFPTEDNACYLWDDSGVPPEVGRLCAGSLPWRGERYVPVPVEDQFAVCLTDHYGSCRWLRERQWHKRETGLVCPLLGTAEDRRQKYLYACSKNVCHADVPHDEGTDMRAPLWRRFFGRRGRGTPISAEKQRAACLTEQYHDCSRYNEHLRHSGAGETP